MKNFQSIFAKGKKQRYQKKDIIISPTTISEEMYRIEEGFVYGYTRSNKNKKRIQNILKPGEIFPILQPPTGQPGRFYVEALTNVSLLSLPKEGFLKNIYANKKLIEEYINALTGYLNRYTERVENLELETLPKKVAGKLLYFGSHFGEEQGTKVFIELPLTQEFIAESINVSRENISRELSKLVQEKIIEFEGKNLVILNAKKLAKKI